jgi:hypothetical protein
MFTRRDLAGTAGALLADAGPVAQRGSARWSDIHAHWYPPQWLEWIEKEPEERRQDRAQCARQHGTSFPPSVTFQPQYTDIPSA